MDMRYSKYIYICIYICIPKIYIYIYIYIILLYIDMDIIFSIQIPGWFFQPFDHAKSRSCPTTPRYDLKSS